MGHTRRAVAMPQDTDRVDAEASDGLVVFLHPRGSQLSQTLRLGVSDGLQRGSIAVPGAGFHLAHHHRPVRLAADQIQFAVSATPVARQDGPAQPREITGGQLLAPGPDATSFIHELTLGAPTRGASRSRWPVDDQQDIWPPLWIVRGLQAVGNLQFRMRNLLDRHIAEGQHLG